MKRQRFIFFVYIFFVARLLAEAPKSFVLITMLYNEENSIRFQEYKTCFELNKNHPLIEKIQVFYDTTRDIPGTKSMMMQYLEQQDCQLSLIERRPSYQEIIEFANIQYPDSYVIVANGDIFFNDTLFKLTHYEQWKSVFFALTRWNVQDDNTTLLLEGFGPYIPNTMSADCWIFKTPFSAPLDTDSIFLGSEGCDNKLANVMQKAGYLVKNPCLSLQTCHLHQSQIRHYKDEKAKSNISFKGVPVRWDCLEGFEKDKENYKNQVHLLKPYTHTNNNQEKGSYSSSYIFITMLYNEQDPIRIKEYKTALQANKDNERIKEIHVFYDTSKDYLDETKNEMLIFIKKMGCSITYIKDRVSFGEFFLKANEIYPHSFVIFANADIYFDKSIEKLDSCKNWEKKCFALTRWNMQPDDNYFLEAIQGGFPNFASQDAWLFKTPISISETMKNIKMGGLECDGGIAYALLQEGYDVSNPCASIHACHLDASQKKMHDVKKAYQGEKALLPWSFLETHTEDRLILEYELKRVQMYDLFKIPKKDHGISLIILMSEERNLYKRLKIQLSLLKNKINPYIKNIFVLYKEEDFLKAEADNLLDFLYREKITIIKIQKDTSVEKLFKICSSLNNLQNFIAISQAESFLEADTLEKFLARTGMLNLIYEKNKNSILFCKDMLINMPTFLEQYEDSFFTK